MDSLDSLNIHWDLLRFIGYSSWISAHFSTMGARCQGGDPHRPPGALHQVDQRTAAGAAGEPQDTTVAKKRLGEPEKTSNTS